MHKKLLYAITGIIIGLSLTGVAYAQLTPFTSKQLAPTPSNGNCLTTNGAINSWSSSCGSGGGGGGAGTFATTSPYGTTLVQYPYTTLFTSLDSSATSTSGWWYDPLKKVMHATYASTTALTVSGNAYVAGNIGIGTTTPFSKLSVSTTAQQAGTLPLFTVASTSNTVLPFFQVYGNGNVGLGTTSPGTSLSIGNTNGINLVPTATSTYGSGGINIASGCFAIATVCVGGGGGSGTVTNIATTWPIIGGPITNTGTLTFGGLGTSTNLTIGQVPYVTGVNTFGQEATGTVTCTGTASCGAGSYVLGNNLTINDSGAAYSFTPSTFGVTAVSATTTNINDSNGFSSTASSTLFQLTTLTSTSTNATTTNDLNVGNQLTVGKDLILTPPSQVIGTGPFQIIDASGRGFEIRQDANDNWAFDNNYGGVWATAMTLNRQFGYLGIGSTSPAYPLSVEGISSLGNSARAGSFIATTTTASQFPYASTTALSSSNLTSGNCVQASTGGLLTTTGSACSAGGASPDWKQESNTYSVNSLTPTTTIPLEIKSAATSTYVGGIESWNSLKTPYVVATSSTATSTFGGNVVVGTTTQGQLTTIAPAFSVQPSGAVLIGTTTSQGALNIGNDAGTASTTIVTSSKFQVDTYIGTTRYCMEPSSVTAGVVAWSATAGACTP